MEAHHKRECVACRFYVKDIAARKQNGWWRRGVGGVRYNLGEGELIRTVNKKTSNYRHFGRARGRGIARTGKYIGRTAFEMKLGRYQGAGEPPNYKEAHNTMFAYCRH